MSSEGSPYEVSQSGQGGGRGSNTNASWMAHSGGGGIGIHDRSNVNGGRSTLSQVADRCESSIMKTELTALCTMINLISCDPASCRKICN